MFLLSQDKKLIVEMSGVYINTIISRRKDIHQVYCISKGILKCDAITREYLLGEFRSMERAIKEVTNISCALSKGDIVYEIKPDE